MYGTAVSTRMLRPALVLAVVFALIAGPGAVATGAADAGGPVGVAGSVGSAGESTLGAPVETGLASARTTGDDPTPIGPSVDAATQVDNGSTVRHRDPSTYDEAGEQSGPGIGFQQRLAETLGEDGLELSQEEYDLASEYVGDSFKEEFEGALGGADDGEPNETAARFEAAAETLAELTAIRQEYAETRETYEAARDANEERRARTVARDLENLAERVNATSASLLSQYESIETETGSTLTESREAVTSMNETVQARQASIREAAFEETRLSVRRVDGGGAVSFVDPMRATGTLSTAAGDPIADESVRLAVGNRTLSVETGADGSFAVTYRPVAIVASAESIPVAYEPASESVYLGAETSVDASIEPVEATIESPAVDADPVGFADEPAVETTVRVDGDPVADLPLSIRLGGEAIGTAETDANGTLAAPASIPASVDEGERDLAIALPFEGRALRAASAATAVSVAETPSSLSVEASRTPAGDVAVTGSYTAAGTGVAEASIVVAVADGTVTTVTTGPDGRFETTLSPATASGETAVTVSTDDAGSNLEPAEASVTIDAGGDAARGPFAGLPAWVVGLVCVALAVALAGGWWWLRRRQRGEIGRVGSIEASRADATGAIATRSAPETLLSRATDALGDGHPDEAVRAAYVAVRRRLDDGDDRTHWEFYRAYASAASAGDPGEPSGDANERTGDAGGTSGDADERAGDAAATDDVSTAGEPIGADELRTLTAAYERAAFGPESVDRSTAERILSRARAACGATDDADTEPDESGANRRLDVGPVASGDD